MGLRACDRSKELKRGRKAGRVTSNPSFWSSIRGRTGVSDSHVPEAAAAGTRGRIGAYPQGNLPHLGARKVQALWAQRTWLACVRDVSPGVDGPSSPQFPPS